MMNKQNFTFPNLLGISGHIMSGKDEVANMIRFFHNYKRIKNDGYESDQTLWQEYLDWCNQNDIEYDNDYNIIKFADKLKDCVCIILGCTREDLESQEFKNKELGPEWWYFKTPSYPNQLVSYLGNEYLVDKYDIIKLTPRLILQLLGTQGGRMIIHPEIWVNATFAEYKSDCNPCILSNNTGTVCHICSKTPYPNFPNWLITDTRFPNESQPIRDRKGLLIRVNRPIEQRFPKEWKDFIHAVDCHYTEKNFLSYWKTIDYEFYEKLTHESEVGLDKWTDWDYVIDNNATLEDLLMKVYDIVMSSECDKCKKKLNIK